MPRSASSCGTLIRGPRIVYPPRLSSDRGSPVYPSLVLGLVRSCDDVKPCLGTCWGTIRPGFTVTGRFPLIQVQNLRFEVRAHACEGGHMQAPIPTLHHTHTHMLGTHASFHLIPTFSWTSSGETLMIYGPPIVYPLDILLTVVARRSSLLFCV